MDSTFHCAHVGHRVDAEECAEITLSATQDMAATCAACQRKSPPAQKAKAKRLSAWERISAATGLDTRSKVAAELGCSVSNFCKQLDRLDERKLPRSDNTITPAILELCGLRLRDFIPGAPDIADIITPPAKAAPPAPETPPAIPEATSQGADAASTFGPLAEQQAENAAPLLDDTGAQAQVPQGDLAQDLANPASIEHMPGQGLARDHSGDATEMVEQPGAHEADDWQEYTGVAPVPVTSPKLTLDKRGRFSITACGVREYGINAPYVQPLWSPSRKQIGLRFRDQDGQGVLKCSRSYKHLLHFHAVGFLRQFGITLAPGQYPLQREPSGLLVATIETKPQAGEEAKAS